MNYEDMPYTEVFLSMCTDSIVFDCSYPCTFLDTLADDGYDEFLRLSSEDRVERIKGGLTSDACTGDIYVDQTDSYGKVSIHKYSVGEYCIQVDVRPAYTNNKHSSNTFMNAVAAMYNNCS